LTAGLPGEEECCDAKIKSATSAMIPIMSIGLEALHLGSTAGIKPLREHSVALRQMSLLFNFRS
jgi:hypothetical protein